MAVGSTISTILKDFSIFMDDNFFAPATLMIVISICLLVVSLTGFLGAIKESTMLVNIVSKSSRKAFHSPSTQICSFSFQFALLLFVVFSMELTAAALAYMMHSQVEMTLIRTMNESFMMYNDHERPYIANGIDFMQSNVS